MRYITPLYLLILLSVWSYTYLLPTVFAETAWTAWFAGFYMIALFVLLVLLVYISGNRRAGYGS